MAPLLGLLTAVYFAEASAAWPPSGIAVAAVLALGTWTWPRRAPSGRAYFSGFLSSRPVPSTRAQKPRFFVIGGEAEVSVDGDAATAAMA